MATFAELDDNNVVINVLAMDNDQLIDENGNESEEIGLSILSNIFGSNKKFVQTSISGKIRKRLACIGMIYNKEIDAFINEQPYPSWTLDVNTATWIPPIPKPGEPYVYDHTWNEENKSWDPISVPG